MATGNLLFVYDTVTDRPGVTLTASSEAQPVANLLDLRPMKRWAAEGCEDESVLLDAGAGNTLDIDTIAFVGHNGTSGNGLDEPGATVETIISDNVDLSSPEVIRTDELWPPIYGLGDRFGLNMGGYPLLSEFAQFTPFRVIRLDAQANRRYCHFGFVDATNPDGQFKLGRIMAGVGWQPGRNFRYGWSYKWIDTSQVRDTDGGSFIGSRKVKLREFTLSIGSDSLGLEECLAEADDMLRILGNTRAMLMCLFPDGTLKRLYRTSAYVRLVGEASIVGQHYELGSVAQLVAREIR